MLAQLAVHDKFVIRKVLGNRNCRCFCFPKQFLLMICNWINKKLHENEKKNKKNKNVVLVNPFFKIIEKKQIGNNFEKFLHKQI